jgi:hypothetical protein
MFYFHLRDSSALPAQNRQNTVKDNENTNCRGINFPSSALSQPLRNEMWFNTVPQPLVSISLN